MSTLNIRQKLVDIAKSKVGVREVPRNSNRGPDVEMFQRATDLHGTGWAWCAAFMCWTIREWGKLPEVLEALKKTPLQFEHWRPKTAGAYAFDDWAESRGLKVYDENENPGRLILHTGDLLTYDSSHIGILDTDSDGGKTLHTCEGNTDAAGSREGGGVYMKIRPRSFARTVIRILE